MRRICIFLFFLLFCFASFAQSCKVLFIGNSYTSVNNLPELISSIYAASGTEFEYQMSAPGGCTFHQHCSVSLPYIQQGGWDYVVFQEQSQLPSFPQEQFMQESYPYAQELCELVHEYNPQAKILFYMTWGRKNGDAQNCPNYPPLCTYEGMDSLLYARYMMMSEDNQACVSPVGAVWHNIRDHNPEVELYQSDGSHPSYFGSYVAACCFYTSLTGNTPMDISWNGSLNNDLALLAKNAVKTVVYDSLSKWCFQNDTLPNDSTVVHESKLQSFVVYPVPAANTLHIRMPGSSCPVVSLMIFDFAGNLVYQKDGFNSEECLDVSCFPDGNYMLRISDGLQFYSKIITIQH